MKARLLSIIGILMLSAMPRISLADTPSVIREDRVWEYVRSYEEYYEFLQLKFEGTEKIGEKEYNLLHRVKYFRIYNGSDSSVKDLYVDLMPDGEDKISKIREEAGTVFRLLKGFTNDYEIIVYDFNLSRNDAIQLPICYAYAYGAGDTLFENVEGVVDEYPYMYTFKVIATGYEDVCGEECAFMEMECVGGQWYDDFPDRFYRIVDGIGPVGSDDSSCIGTIAMLESWNPLCGYRPATSFSLNRVYSSNENVIYRGKDLDWRECLDKAGASIVIDDDNSLCAYYSLQGVRLERPRKGEVVIRVEGGKSSKIAF